MTHNTVQIDSISAGALTEIEMAKKGKTMDEDKSKALTANIFYGLAGVFGATSVIMFVINPGSDVAEDQEARKLGPEIDVVPVFSPNGGGLEARLKF